jgi:hypothetical protein
MPRFRLLSILFLIPLLAVVLTTGGCGEPERKKSGKRSTPSRDDSDDGKAGDADKGGDETKKSTDGDGGATAGGKRTELKSTGWGSLSGTVTFEGAVPTREPLPGIDKDKDHTFCLMSNKPEETKKETWIVNEEGGKKVVKNVVVFLKLPKNQYFKLPEKDFWPKEVVVDQPFCAYRPHVSVIFAKKWDPQQNKLVPSGQVFKVRNSSTTVTHNTVLKTSKGNVDLGSLQKMTGEVQPDLDPEPKPIDLSCNFHKWMDGTVWALDHPYAAVTDDKGHFEIPMVPAGAEVNVVVWHEAKGFLKEYGGIKGKPMTLKADKNEMNITISK